MRRGADEKFLEGLKKDGRRATSLDNKPAVKSIHAYYWSVYQSLTVTRQSGINGPQRISYTEILSFCVLMGITSFEVRDLICFVVSVLENVYFEWVKDVQQSHERASNRPEGQPDNGITVPKGNWSEANTFSPPFPKELEGIIR